MEFNSDICEVMHFRLSSSTPTALPELDLPGFKPRLEWRVWNSARPQILRLLSVCAFLPSRARCAGKCNPHTETHNQRDSGGKSHQEWLGLSLHRVPKMRQGNGLFGLPSPCRPSVTHSRKFPHYPHSHQLPYTQGGNCHNTVQRKPNNLQMHASLGTRGETWAPGGNPRGRRENVQTPHIEPAGAVRLYQLGRWAAPVDQLPRISRDLIASQPPPTPSTSHHGRPLVEGANLDTAQN